MKSVFISLFIVVICMAYSTLAQQEQNNRIVIDSLINKLLQQKKDTDKVQLLCEISHQYSATSPFDGINYGFQALSLAEELKWQLGIARSNSVLGANYYSQSDFKNAYQHWLISLKIHEKINNKRGIANHLHNIGDIFYSQEDYANALEYYNKALEVSLQMDNKNFATNSYTAIGNVYERQKKYPEALDYHNRALAMDEEMNNRGNVASDQMNIASICCDRGNYANALNMLNKALSIKTELGDKLGIAKCYLKIGHVYLIEKQYSNAEFNAKKSLLLNSELGNLEGIKDANKNLNDIYEQQGKNDKAYPYFKAYITYRDSIYNRENTKKLVQNQMQFDFDKKEALTKVEQAKKDEVAAERLKKEQILSFTGIVGAIILSVFLIVVYRNFSVQKKLNKIISQLISEREKTIELRTAELRIANQKLVDLIHYNAHNIREPLTRIIGVMSLREYVSDAEFMETYWEMMGKSVNDLDVQIKQVIRELEETTEAKTVA